MYAEYWGLTESPFQNTLDERWFHESPVHEEVLARLYYLIEQRRRCGLLFGSAGVGKSLLLHILNWQVIRSQRQVVFLSLMGMTGYEMLWNIATALNLTPSESDSPLILWRKVRDSLKGLQFSQIQTVFLLDDFDQADNDCLPILHRLAHLGRGRSLWNTFIVAARNSQWLDSAQGLAHLSDLRLDLTALDWQQTYQYVHGLLQQAGCQRELFDPAAIDALYEHTRGVPRDINRLCDLALLAGMGEDCDRIDAEIVHAAAEELQARPQPRPRLAAFQGLGT